MDYHDAEGRRHQVKAGRTKPQAGAMLRKKLDEVQQEIILGGKSAVKIRFVDFAAEYLEKYSKINKRSWDRDKLSLRHLSGYLGNKFLHEIGPKDIERYKAQRSILVAKATVNRELACLKHLFTIAIQWGCANRNPGKAVKLFKENNQRTRYLEPEYLRRLYVCCPPQIRPVVIFAANTGMRFSEIMNLKWVDVDMERGIIMVRNTKNDEPRDVPMNNRVRGVLHDIRTNLKSLYVFCKPDGQPRRSIRTSFEKALKKAGIEDFHFHDLRHTFASHLVMAGVDIKTVQELLGHKDIQMTLRYSHLSPAHKKDAVLKLEGYGKPDRIATLMQHGKMAKTGFAVEGA